MLNVGSSGSAKFKHTERIQIIFNLPSMVYSYKITYTVNAMKIEIRLHTSKWKDKVQWK